jgi:4-hydroxy-2-oxoglutarate aldolase
MNKKKKETGLQVIQLNGIYPPIPTTFDAKGRLALEPLQQNIVALSQQDLRGFVVLGSNGEYVMLTEQEKYLVLDAARQAIPPDMLMIAGTGCQSTGETLDLTQKAAELGADVALVITPHYYRKHMTAQVLINHFNTIADHSPIPILIYNMPACTGIDLAEDVIEFLARHPNIIGIKDSSGNVIKMAALRQKVGPGFQILAGSGSFLLPALSVGAIGGVLALANIAPKQCISIYQHYQQNKRQKARDLQVQMVPVNTAVTAKWGIPGLKAAMDAMEMYGGPVRLPLLPLSKEQKQELDGILVQGGVKE